jgi:hypothetical protein
MTAYDDAEVDCPMCSIGLDADALCSCDVDPMCVCCHRVYHVERSWVTKREDELDRQMRDGLAGWGEPA